MPLRSMTGYGSASGQTDEWTLDVECRSVNHKGLDVRIDLPSELRALESVAKKAVQRHVERGRVRVHLDFEFDHTRTEQNALIDPKRFRTVRRQLEGLADKEGLGPVTMENVLEFRDFFESEATPQVAADNPVLLKTLDEALEQLVEARTTEGLGLEEDFNQHLDTLASKFADYRERKPDALETLRDGIEERVREVMTDCDAGEPDEQRLAQEIVYYTDRADVSEELQRAESHVENLRTLVNDTPAEEPVGKEIDFYLQEMVRETNTLSSKSHTAKLTEIAITTKSTVEKMREQAANVE